MRENAEWSGLFAAVCLSVLQTAVLHGLRPAAYLRYYLDACAQAGGAPEQWVKSKNLASKILSMAARQLPKDWQTIYGYTPVLPETFVDQNRYRGTSYKAANWFLAGCTEGRGRQGKSRKGRLPLKTIYLFPLRKDCRRILRKKHVSE